MVNIYPIRNRLGEIVEDKYWKAKAIPKHANSNLAIEFFLK